MHDDRREDGPNEADSGQEQPRDHPVAAASYRRPGPHGAAAIRGEEEDPAVEAEIQRAYRRAERSTRRHFTEVTPHTVVAAEACTSLDGEEEAGARSQIAPQSRACFLATAAYGDSHAPDVERLRTWRDRRLIVHPLGVAFVRAYYRCSPPLARLIARKPRLRTVMRRVIGCFAARAAL